MRPGDVYRFGPYELDSGMRRLIRDGEPVALPDRHVELLLRLLSNAGHIVTKDSLIEAAWKDVAVSDNSVEQAISGLRKALGTQQTARHTSKRWRGAGIASAHPLNAVSRAIPMPPRRTARAIPCVR